MLLVGLSVSTLADDLDYWLFTAMYTHIYKQFILCVGFEEIDKKAINNLAINFSSYVVVFYSQQALKSSWILGRKALQKAHCYILGVESKISVSAGVSAMFS